MHSNAQYTLQLSQERHPAGHPARRGHATRGPLGHVHPSDGRPPDHPDRSATRRGALSRAGSIPLRDRASHPTWRSFRDRRRTRAEGLVRLHRAQLLPDTPLLGLGDRLPGLFRRGRALGLVDRRRGGQRDAAPVPDGRSDLLELPVGRLQLDRRDDLGRALGRDPRVHDDGADPALVAAARAP